MPRKSTPKQLNYQQAGILDADVNNDAGAARYWETKTLAEMSTSEWEQLCDGCAQCCLLKLEDDDTGDIAVTRLSCHLLNIGSCQCSNYAERRAFVPDCVKLSLADVHELRWLPQTCAYRLIAEGKPLAWWHPLVSGDPETVHEAGISVRNYAISENAVPSDKVWKYIVSWIKS